MGAKTASKRAETIAAPEARAKKPLEKAAASAKKGTAKAPLAKAISKKK